MSIQNLQAIQSNTDYVIENIKEETKEAASKVEKLFSSESFYNGGASSADYIQSEIKRLEAFLAEKEEEMSQNYAMLKRVNSELNEENDKLKQEIYDITKQADVAERVQKKFIESAIDDVNQSYADGEIEKSEMAPLLAQKIAKYCCLDQSIVSASMRLNDKKSKINVLVARIATIIDKANGLEQQSKIASGTLVLMKNLMGKMSLGTSNSATAANERPIYTPTKQALVDRLAQGIKGTGAGSDRNKLEDNPQLAKLKDFLGMNGDGTMSDKGILADSMLLQMKEAGFTQKEAMYAVAWIFDGSNINYKPGETWSIPWGHGTEAHNIYAALNDQMNKLWNIDGSQTPEQITENPTEDTTGGENSGETTGGTPTNVTPTDIPDAAEEGVKRTDPIGYSVGDKTYEFVMDNGNNIFDGYNEFLGAANGINELKDLDVNHDGLISSSELSSNENLFVLMTDHKTGKHSFMAATDAVKSIDLTSLQSKDWENINGNKLTNVFTVNTASGTQTQGYQTLDCDYYLNKSYNGVKNAEMAVSVDNSALMEAQNIFNSIEFTSSDKYDSYNEDAANDTANAQKHVSTVSDEMDDNYNSAADGLQAGKRAETAEEKKARIAKEIEELEKEQERLEALIARQQEQYAKENEDKEEEEKPVQVKTPEMIRAEEIRNLRASYRAGW